MAVALFDAFFSDPDYKARGLNRTEAWILLFMAWRANAEGIAWPSAASLAKSACVHVKSAERTLRRLRKLGFLEHVGVASYNQKTGQWRVLLGERRNGPKRTNVYKVNVPTSPVAGRRSTEAQSNGETRLEKAHRSHKGGAKRCASETCMVNKITPHGEPPDVPLYKNRQNKQGAEISDALNLLVEALGLTGDVRDAVLRATINVGELVFANVRDQDLACDAISPAALARHGVRETRVGVATPKTGSDDAHEQPQHRAIQALAERCSVIAGRLIGAQIADGCLLTANRHAAEEIKNHVGRQTLRELGIETVKPRSEL